MITAFWSSECPCWHDKDYTDNNGNQKNDQMNNNNSQCNDFLLKYPQRKKMSSSHLPPLFEWRGENEAALVAVSQNE